jgi:preprotein translocase subunit SecG
MHTFLTILYVFVCVFLILVVLLQAGKGGGMGALGGGSQTVFGGAGAGNFLTRLTAVSAILFMVLSASLAYLSSTSEKSLDKAAQLAAQAASKKGSAPSGQTMSAPPKPSSPQKDGKGQ